MIEINRNAQVGDKIIFPDYFGKQIKGEVVKACKHCSLICVKREDGFRGGGCHKDWVIKRNWSEIRILNTNPNSNIIIKEN